MNWQHIQTFLWLRSRLRSNQRRRAGAISAVIQNVLVALLIAAAVAMFIAGVAVGFAALPQASAFTLMLVWDGLIVGLLFFWATELLMDLQRSELLSVEKFLHLPVSMSGAFLINYVGSVLTPSIILFAPAMAGLSIGLTASRGPAMLWQFPMLAAFLLLMTAVAYQFRGWLAALMTNKRRRRSVLAFATIGFVLIAQLPGLVAGPRRSYDGEQFRQIVLIANKAIPLGWLPYSVMASAEGSAAPAALSTLGFLLIGAASLRRSYRTTLRLYTGQIGAAKRPAASAVAATRAAPDRRAFLERRIPFLSEHAATVALASFRSFVRAPETKLMLLTPVVLALIFGSMLFAASSYVSPFVRPLQAVGANLMVLISMVGLAGNLFGFDRSGFRTFVLSAAPRKDILMGKNLALAPPAIVLGLIVTLVIQYGGPMRIDHLLATLALTAPMYLVYCLIANLSSIFAPMPVAPGSMKPVGAKGITILLHIIFFFLFPLALAPTLIPLGLEFLFDRLGWLEGLPLFLSMTLVECGLVAYLYPIALGWEGKLLQDREQRILEIVTSRVE